MSNLIPMAYIKKTARGTYISLSPIDNSLGEKTDKCIPLYSKEQLSKEVIDFIKFAIDNCDVPCEISEIKTWGDELLKSVDKQN